MGEKIKTGISGQYGGQFIPETLMNAVQESEKAYLFYKKDAEYQNELAFLIIYPFF